VCHKVLTTTTGIELTLKDFSSCPRALVILGNSIKNVQFKVISLFVEQWRRVTRYNATQWEGNVWLRRMVGGKAIGPVFTEFVCVFTVQASGLFCCINCLLDDTVMLCTNVCDHGSFRFSNAMLYPTTLTYVA